MKCCVVCILFFFAQDFYKKMKQRRALEAEGLETDPLLGHVAPIQASVLREETDVKSMLVVTPLSLCVCGVLYQCLNCVQAFASWLSVCNEQQCGN